MENEGKEQGGVGGRRMRRNKGMQGGGEEGPKTRNSEGLKERGGGETRGNQTKKRRRGEMRHRNASTIIITTIKGIRRR